MSRKNSGHFAKVPRATTTGAFLLNKSLVQAQGLHAPSNPSLGKGGINNNNNGGINNNYT